MTAKASIAVLQGRPGVAFRRLLMTRTTLWRKCDAFVQASFVCFGGCSKSCSFLPVSLWLHDVCRPSVLSESLLSSFSCRCLCSLVTLTKMLRCMTPLLKMASHVTQAVTCRRETGRETGNQVPSGTHRPERSCFVLWLWIQLSYDTTRRTNTKLHSIAFAAPLIMTLRI